MKSFVSTAHHALPPCPSKSMSWYKSILQILPMLINHCIQNTNSTLLLFLESGLGHSRGSLGYCLLSINLKGSKTSLVRSPDLLLFHWNFSVPSKSSCKFICLRFHPWNLGIDTLHKEPLLLRSALGKQIGFPRETAMAWHLSLSLAGGASGQGSHRAYLCPAAASPYSLHRSHNPAHCSARESAECSHFHLCWGNSNSRGLLFLWKLLMPEPWGLV